ncbi:MAG: DUF1272 domain-containing protein [Acidobacteria bacterium]|nr:MAG: DUF1272 domain-containing protein [Acidobacteriota bacterium]
MSLELRTKCEKCGVALFADGIAFICSYECTFCEKCAKTMNCVCPNCQGELVRRPRKK